MENELNELNEESPCLSFKIVRGRQLAMSPTRKSRPQRRVEAPILGIRERRDDTSVPAPIL